MNLSAEASLTVEPEQTPLFSRTVVNRPLPDGVVVYASGTNRPSDIRGVIAAGIPVGVDVSRLSESAMRELLKSDLPLFLDSGAFSEVSIKNGEISITRPIKDSQWNTRLDKYLLIARHLGHKPSQICARVTIVAPDCVGSQGSTLNRLLKFRDKIRAVHAAGADVVVPLQTGQLNVVDFYLRAKSILGIEIVPGMPMKKAATTMEDIQHLIEHVRPKRIHFLGLGADSHRADPLTRFIRHFSQTIAISMDANRIRAGVGKNRPITRREKKLFDEAIPGWTSEIDFRESGGELHDLTELLFQPSRWLTGTKLTQFADSLTWLPVCRRTEFLYDPNKFVQADENLNDWLHERLMQAYFEYVSGKTRRAARTLAVTETLSKSKIAHQRY